MRWTAVQIKPFLSVNPHNTKCTQISLLFKADPVVEMARKEDVEEARIHALASDMAALLPPSLDTATAGGAAADEQDASVLPAPSVLEQVIQADVAHELALYNTQNLVVAEAVFTHRRKQHALRENGNNMLVTTLLEACIAAGDVETVCLLVDNGVHVDARLGECYDTSPLRMACQYGQLKIVQLLVARGARVNGDDGNCPGFSKPVLAVASNHGHLEIVKWLVENGGARVNDETIAGVSPLADAVRRGDLQIARYLVLMGANTMSTLRPWWSLWYLAIKLGRLAILKCFAESKLEDLTQRSDQLRLGVLQCAAKQKNIGILQCLLSLDVFGRSELIECLAQAQDVEFVKLLVSKGANVNAYNARGDTPLFTAIKNGSCDLVETLLSLGADANKPGSQDTEHSAIHTMAVRGQLDLLKLVRRICGCTADLQAPSQRYRSTPLHLAAFAGHVDIVRYLLEVLPSLDVDINAENYRYETPLILAAREGHLETVQLLVSGGAAVNHRTHGIGETALFCAAKAGWCDIVQFLCEHGADVDGHRYDGVTALCAAAKRGHTEILELLAEARGVGSNTATSDLSALREAVKYGHTDVVRVLLARNANARDSQEQWSTLVCRAIFSNNAEVVHLLVNHGAFDINAAYTATIHDMEFDITPLVAAAGCGHLRLVKYLCQEGADAQHTANDDEAALFAAAARGHLDIVRYLVEEQNANFEKVNSFGLTPLEVAVNGRHHGHHRTTAYLKSCGTLVSTRSTPDQETGDQPSSKDEVAAATFLSDYQVGLWIRRKSALDLLFSRSYYQ